MNGTATPAVSVIMATYNGVRTIRASIDSVLSQTCRDLELIVADDGSTDGTLAVLEGVGDTRLRVLRNDTNMGVVASRNRCFSEARAPAVAMLDHDDLSAPTRLARQLAHLDANPDTVLVGTEARVLDHCGLHRMSHPDKTTPQLIAWLLQVANPLVCSSVMFRADAVRRLGVFMQSSYTYADDYEFYHRMAALGRIARLDRPLTIYRVHAGNAYKRHEQTMLANAARVLVPGYRKLFGGGAEEAAEQVVQHLSAGRPVKDWPTLQRVCAVFDRLNAASLAAPDMDAVSAALLKQQAGVLWRRTLRATNRLGGVRLPDLLACCPAGVRTSPADAALLAAERLQFGGSMRKALRRWVTSTTREKPPVAASLFGRTYVPAPSDTASPPTLFVVVDTEAEFDWDKPFARDLTSVAAMDDIGRGQAVFDTYGLRPIYVIDYPVASQARGTAGLRAILQRGGCAIGAHLHPWTNPPFDEIVCTSNSYPGNLDPALEERKLAVLMEAIRTAFGISARFYKAGRYGFGPGTPDALARHGISVDLSVLPGADLRRRGGPDFSDLAPLSYHIAGTPILSVPMTRAAVGAAPSLGRMGQAVYGTRLGELLRVPAMLARLGVAETITLTPEGVTAGEQIRLLRAMLKRGCRQFVLHYHSPSLSTGHTPYARTADEVEDVLSRLADVCRFFFDELGGLPGYPDDLLRMAELLRPDI